MKGLAVDHMNELSIVISRMQMLELFILGILVGGLTMSIWLEMKMQKLRQAHLTLWEEFKRQTRENNIMRQHVDMDIVWEELQGDPEFRHGVK